MALTSVATVRRDGWTQLSLSQSAAGTDIVVADPGDGNRIVVKELTLSLTVDGTVQLTGGTGGGVLTGIMNVSAASGLGLRGTSRSPAIECAPSEALSLVTVTGSARGFLLYKIVPS